MLLKQNICIPKILSLSLGNLQNYPLILAVSVQMGHSLSIAMYLTISNYQSGLTQDVIANYKTNNAYMTKL